MAGQKCFAQTDTLSNPAYLLNQAAERYSTKDYRGVLSSLLLAAGLDHGFPTIPYNIACAYALLCRQDSAMRWLKQAVNLGAWFPAAEDHDLDTLKRLPGFDSIVKQFEFLRQVRGEAAALFTIPENGKLFPPEQFRDTIILRLALRP